MGSLDFTPHTPHPPHTHPTALCQPCPELSSAAYSVSSEFTASFHLKLTITNPKCGNTFKRREFSGKFPKKVQIGISLDLVFLENTFKNSLGVSNPKLGHLLVSFGDNSAKQSAILRCVYFAFLIKQTTIFRPQTSKQMLKPTLMPSYCLPSISGHCQAHILVTFVSFGWPG